MTGEETHRWSRRWCHRVAYADGRLETRAGPLLTPRLDPAVRTFWTLTALLGSVAAAGAIVTVAGAAAPRLIDEGFVDLGLLAFIACFAVGPPGLSAWYFAVIRPRLRRRALASRGRLCVTCGHDLSGRPAGTAACPECGQRIERRDAVIYWCRFLLG